MTIDVQFTELSEEITTDFGEIFEVSDDGDTDMSDYYSKVEIDKLLTTKMDGYIALNPTADLDNLDDGWYILPDGHTNFEQMLGHNYSHTLYQTHSGMNEMDFAVQVLICVNAIMWRSGTADGFESWKNLSLDVIDTLSSTDTSLPLSANQGRLLNEKIGDIDTALDGIIAIQNNLMGVSE